MGHPDITNETPFATETLFVADENGRPLCVPIVKATFDIGTGGVIRRAEEQLPVNPTGILSGDGPESSYIYEPETAFFKPATDVVLVGHAHPAKVGASEVMAGIRVGPVQKLVRVVGDRFMARRSGVARASAPLPVERIPLTYERAFGGWDRRHADPGKHQVDMRNPVGTGFRDKSLDADDDLRLPNVEDPEQPFQSYGDSPTPAGVGFVSPNWSARSRYAGTYDDTWATKRSPLLPVDFDRRFFNAASPGLVAPGYLRGDESVIVLNASPEGRLAFNLPAVLPPACAYGLHGRRKPALLAMPLDTVIVDTDERRLTLTWRTHFPLRSGPHDVAFVRLSDDPGLARPQ